MSAYEIAIQQVMHLLPFQRKLLILVHCTRVLQADLHVYPNLSDSESETQCSWLFGLQWASLPFCKEMHSNLV